MSATVVNIASSARKKEQVFEEVFRSLYQPLHAYAFQLLRDTDAAENVVQDVFLKLWEKADTLLLQDGVKPYLYRSVHNACINQFRKGKVAQTYVQYATHQHNPHSQAAAEKVQAGELTERIQSALEKLPPQCREIFGLSRFGHLSYGEIASTLQLSIKTIEAQMGKALRIMRRELAEFLPITLVVFLEWMIKQLTG